MIAVKVSTRTRYASRALAELAAVGADRTLSVREMAESQQLSPKYLEQIFAALKAGGLVEAVRGANGGYRLARAPEKTTLGEVFRVLEGATAPVGCVEDPGSCAMAAVCPTRDTWVELGEAVEGVLGRTTVRQLADRLREKGGSSALADHTGPAKEGWASGESRSRKRS